VAALRAVGCLVHDTSRLGGGFPDAVAAFRGRLVLLEIKDGRKPPSARKLTENEAEFHRTWGTAVAVVETVEQALAAVGARFA
jgi:hypothetical protein